MLSQHHAIGLQTGCMVIVLAPVVEAARLPRVCPMALGYGLPPCNNNIIMTWSAPLNPYKLSLALVSTTGSP